MATSIPRIIVRFKDGFLEYLDGAEDTFVKDKDDYVFWQKLLAQFASQAKGSRPLSLNKLFTSLSPTELKAKWDLAKRIDKSYRDPSLLNYFTLEYPAGTNLYDLVKTIRIWNSVEVVYVESQVARPPQFTPNNEPDFSRQGYLFGEERNGINAVAAWEKSVAGAGVKFIDLEEGWNLEHQDLMNSRGVPKIQVVSGGVNHSYTPWRSHGTSVLGIVLAQDNETGIIGIAPSAEAEVVSDIYQINDEGDYRLDRPNAILTAIDRLGYGDVLLLETQHVDNCEAETGETQPWPVEVEKAIFAAIRLGTALGIVIVEPAGNGWRNLDSGYQPHIADRDTGICVSSPGLPSEVALNPLLQGTYEDSGAIMVAGGMPNPVQKTSYIRWYSEEDDHEHTHRNGTNYGNRIDCYAWGENIYTLATRRDRTTREYSSEYMESFGGTSGASAMIAGAALVVQSAAKAQLGRPLSPYQLRGLLKNPLYGTGSSDLIGVMPDLLEVVANVPSLSHIYLRDFEGDSGIPPSTTENIASASGVEQLLIIAERFQNSPDLIITTDPVPRIGASFPGHQPFNLNPSLTNYIYPRIWKRGVRSISDVVIYYYYANENDLTHPSRWRYINRTPSMSVSVGSGEFALPPQVKWSGPPPSGSTPYHLIGFISSAEAPSPINPLSPSLGLKFGRDTEAERSDPKIAASERLRDFLRFVRRNPNVAWRKFMTAMTVR